MVDWFGGALELTRSDAQWEAFLAKGDKWGFNAVRVVVYPPTYTEAKMEAVLTRIEDHGARAIIDNHGLASYFPAGSPLFGSAQLRSWWKARALEWRGDSRVEAFELFNEPSGVVLDASVKSPNTQTGIIREYAALTDAVREVDAGRTCIWIDWWGTSSSLPDSYTQPAPYYRPNTVVTFHPYAYGSNTNVDQIVQTRIDEVQRRCAGLWGSDAIWCGEIESVPGEPASIRFSYTAAMIRRCLLEGYGFNYWRYGNAVDDGGCDPDAVIAASGFTGGAEPPPVEPPPVVPPPVVPPPVTPPTPPLPPAPEGFKWVPFMFMGVVLYMLAQEAVS